MSKPVSIAARNAQVGDSLMVHIGVRHWGKITRVVTGLGENHDQVRLITDNHMVGCPQVGARHRVTVQRASKETP